MPAAYAHYVFGKEVYRRLPGPERQMIRENREAYLLGLHGPDLLFYYYPVCKNRLNRLGEQMHRELASDFFGRCRRKYQERPSYVMLSYLLGFICHYTLDSECHPYISAYMKEHKVSHTDIETELDRVLLEKDGKNPVSHPYTCHLHRDADTEAAIASVLGITEKQADRSIRGFHRTIHFFQCPDRKKEDVLRFLFDVCTGNDFTSGLLMTGRPRPKCRKSTEFLTGRLEGAAGTAVELICEYHKKIDTQQALSARFERDYE